MQERLAAGEPAALRFAVPAGDVTFDDVIRGPITIGSEQIGDFIILRSDHLPSYNFAAVVDDAAMAITHVIRGDDHLTNTARQELLRRALYPGAAPPVYAHHAMILAPGGGKLSKRHGATAVGDYRRLGYLPQAIVNYLALLSWSHGDDEVLGIERLVADFELSALSGSPAIFDMSKLDWLNHQWIMASSDAEHERLVAERLPRRAPRRPPWRPSPPPSSRRSSATATCPRPPPRCSSAPRSTPRRGRPWPARPSRSPSLPTCAAPRRRPS